MATKIGQTGVRSLPDTHLRLPAGVHLWPLLCSPRPGPLTPGPPTPAHPSSAEPGVG